MAINFLPIILALVGLFPSISKLIKDNNPATIEKIISVAKHVTNSQTTEGIVRILNQDPMAREKFEQSLAQIEKEVDEILAKDRDSARKRDIAMLRHGVYNMRADIMVVCAALGLAACLFSLVLYQTSMPGEAIGIISTIAGIFGACLKDAYAFEFGSSRGSKNKDEQVALILKKFEQNEKY
ncbi:MAG: hypothetical protein J0G29_05065 [Alphaproteobacteria bacterium]|nr:hypothetical protein [Alphaproteobacteria bacterium]OJV47950.1 MAG: hypothetical protein BGO28_03735 [Alphaproteobacteria bacterium 43-37]